MQNLSTDILSTRSPFLQALARLMLVMFLAASLLGCAKEYLPFSSGALSGEITQAPADWTQVASAEIVQFETNRADPYSVNLWVIGKDSTLYVYAGDNYTTWAEHLEKDARARLGVEGKLYELTATRVTDQTEFDQFAIDWDEKYGSSRPKGSSVTEVWLFRLSAI